MLELIDLVLPQLFWLALTGTAVMLVADTFMPWGRK